MFFLSIFRYVINELIETEQDYVKDLGSIVEVCTDFIGLVERNLSDKIGHKQVYTVTEDG